MLTTDVIPIIVASGTSSKKTSQAIEPGRVVGVGLITKNGANPGMVRARIRDNKGNDLVKLQPIEMLQPKEASFLDAFYPLSFETNSQTIEVEIIATANFTTDLIADFVFIYNC